MDNAISLEYYELESKLDRMFAVFRDIQRSGVTARIAVEASDLVPVDPEAPKAGQAGAAKEGLLKKILAVIKQIFERIVKAVKWVINALFPKPTNPELIKELKKLDRMSIELPGTRAQVLEKGAAAPHQDAYKASFSNYESYFINTRSRPDLRAVVKAAQDFLEHGIPQIENAVQALEQNADKGELTTLDATLKKVHTDVARYSQQAEKANEDIVRAVEAVEPPTILGLNDYNAVLRRNQAAAESLGVFLAAQSGHIGETLTKLSTRLTKLSNAVEHIEDIDRATLVRDIGAEIFNSLRTFFDLCSTAKKLLRGYLTGSGKYASALAKTYKDIVDQEHEIKHHTRTSFNKFDLTDITEQLVKSSQQFTKMAAAV